MFCKSCELEIVICFDLHSYKQFHGHKSCKTRESTLWYVGNFEENINLSHTSLAVIHGLLMQQVLLSVVCSSDHFMNPGFSICFCIFMIILAVICLRSLLSLWKKDCLSRKSCCWKSDLIRSGFNTKQMEKWECWIVIFRKQSC